MDFTANVAGKRKRKLTAFPLLIVLFVFSYYLLTKLVIEQDRTIDSQRGLIHQLFKDNAYLSKLRKHAGNISKSAKTALGVRGGGSAQTQSGEVESAQVPLIQVPLTQVPLTQVPSNKIGPQANAKTGRSARKGGKGYSAKPPVEPTDPSDMRRVLFSI